MPVDSTASKIKFLWCVCVHMCVISMFLFVWSNYMHIRNWANDNINQKTQVVSLKIDYFNQLQWRHNGRDGVSNHQPHHCLLNCLFRGRSKKTSKLRVICLCAGNSPVTGEFPAQMARNAENVFTVRRHHATLLITFRSRVVIDAIQVCW